MEALCVPCCGCGIKATLTRRASPGVMVAKTLETGRLVTLRRYWRLVATRAALDPERTILVPEWLRTLAAAWFRQDFAGASRTTGVAGSAKVMVQSSVCDSKGEGASRAAAAAQASRA